MFSFVWHEHDKVLSVTDESNEGIRCHMTSGLIYESNIRIITGTCCSCSNPVVLCASHYNASSLKFCGGINGNLHALEYSKSDRDLPWQNDSSNLGRRLDSSEKC